MKKNLVRSVMGCLVLALGLAGCGGGWKDTGAKCNASEWKDLSQSARAMAAQVGGMCDKGKTATDMRCKDGRAEVQCK